MKTFIGKSYNPDLKDAANARPSSLHIFEGCPHFCGEWAIVSLLAEGFPHFCDPVLSEGFFPPLRPSVQNAFLIWSGKQNGTTKWVWSSETSRRNEENRHNEKILILDADDIVRNEIG